MDERLLDAEIAVSLFGWYWVVGENDEWRMLIPPDDHPASRHHWAAEWDQYGIPNWLPHYCDILKQGFDHIGHKQIYYLGE